MTKAASDVTVCRISSIGKRGVLVIGKDDEETSAVVAGSIYQSMKPVPGDRVETVLKGDQLVVERILPRGSVLERTSPLGKSHIIAANLDRVLIVVSISDPPLRTGFIDRALAASEWRSLKASIVVNKIDLVLSREDRRLLSEVISVYRDGAAYPVYPLSCESGEGCAALLEDIRGETLVMTGPSGAGKTSLARLLKPGLNLRVGALNPKTSKGRHTTVSARLVPLGDGTSLIDTPGLRMFSIEHIPTDRLQDCFPEFEPYLGRCSFRNCRHLSEPGCAVKEACSQGAVAEQRYLSYCGFMKDAMEGSSR